MSEPSAAAPLRATIFRWLEVLFFLAGLVLLLILVIKISGAEVTPAFQSFFKGIAGSKAAWGETLARTAALAFPGLAVALAFRAGLLNIGAEGQFLCGAVGATAWATQVLPAGTPEFIALPSTVLAGAVFGSAWAFLPAMLRKWRGISEVISTILLNEVARVGLKLLVKQPALLQEPGTVLSKSAEIPACAQWAAWDRTPFHSGTFLMIPAAILLHFWIFYTRSGMGLRASGFNPRAALACGIPVARISLTAFLVSGGLAGMGGAIAVMAQGRLYDVSPYPDCGYLAIAVALCAALHPLWVLPAAYAFAALQSGANEMQSFAHVPSEAVFLVEGIVILGLLARGAHVPGRPAELRQEA